MAILVVGRGQAVTVVAFNGMAASNRVFEWARSFSSLPVNLVGVQDVHYRWYQIDTLSIAAAVRQAVAPLGGERLVMIGGSAGGFAALLFGRILNADRVLAFCPQSATGAIKRALGDMRWRSLCTLTPTTAYSDIAGSHPRAIVHVAGDDGLDLMHARRLLPARLVVHPAGGHQLPAALNDTGGLRPLLEEAISA